MPVPILAAVAKTAAKTAAKSATKKVSKQALQNARRKGDRKIAALQKELKKKGLSEEQKDFFRSDIKRTKEWLEGTYQIRNGKRTLNTQETIRSNVNYLNANSITNSMFRGSKASQNYFFQGQINLASKKAKGTLTKESEDSSVKKTNGSVLTEAQAKIFYRATQGIWQGKVGNRNRMIMKYFDVDTLEQAWDIVLNAPSSKLALSIETGEYKPGSDLTPEQQALYDQALADDNTQRVEGSPGYLDYVAQFNPTITWKNGVIVSSGS